MPILNRRLSILLTIIIVLVLGYAFFTMPDSRSPTEKLGDAIHELDKGPDKAARQLESRTPGEKLGDAVKDTGDKIKNSTSGQ
jgi:hypothetical protein